jgi:hypothetical protein
VILAVCLGLGIILRLGVGNPVEQLAHIRLHGEIPLLALLCLQALLPLVQLTGTSAVVAFWLWVATYPVLIGIAWRNRRLPGMSVIALGLLLNALVVILNGGMPVAESAAIAAGLQGRLSVPVGDFTHVLTTSSTWLPWLGDVVPLPGPSWARYVPSVGDLLLCVGATAFLATVKPSAGEGSTARAR